MEHFELQIPRLQPRLLNQIFPRSDRIYICKDPYFSSFNDCSSRTPVSETNKDAHVYPCKKVVLGLDFNHKC